MTKKEYKEYNRLLTSIQEGARLSSEKEKRLNDLGRKKIEFLKYEISKGRSPHNSSRS